LIASVFKFAKEFLVPSSKEKSVKVQFVCPHPALLYQLDEDVKRSSFISRSKYISAVLEIVLSLELPAITSSRVDDLIAVIQLFKSLPLARIRRLATIQNRNFAQMIRHLIEVALSYYPEDVLRADDPTVLSHPALQPINGQVEN
jgi:hypothetical protein